MLGAKSIRLVDFRGFGHIRFDGMRESSQDDAENPLKNGRRNNDPVG